MGFNEKPYVETCTDNPLYREIRSSTYWRENLLRGYSSLELQIFGVF